MSYLMNNFKIQCLPMTILQNHRQNTPESNVANWRGHILIMPMHLFFWQICFFQTTMALLSGQIMNRFLIKIRDIKNLSFSKDL